MTIRKVGPGGARQRASGAGNDCLGETTSSSASYENIHGRQARHLRLRLGVSAGEAAVLAGHFFGERD
ncbi:hypothetical protein GI582_10990 [Sulfitobacter sp. BDSS02]|nr:hypothetical protein [Sulfitobacter sp. BDSS02]MBR9850008.1 hypothetical protein [Paracoccaceae bacterium]